jgi:hypothetical protein
MDESKIWEIRAFVYQYLADTTRPPQVAEIMSRFDLTHEEAGSTYEELHQRHALYLRLPTARPTLPTVPGTHLVFRPRCR